MAKLKAASAATATSTKRLIVSSDCLGTDELVAPLGQLQNAVDADLHRHLVVFFFLCSTDRNPIRVNNSVDGLVESKLQKSL